MLINDKVDAVFIPDSPSRIKATDYNQIKNEIQECITLAGLTPTKDVIQLPDALKILTQQSGAEEVAKIEAAGAEQVQAVNTAGQTQLNAINTAGAQAVQDAQTAANTATAKATEAASSASAAASSATAAEGSASTATTQASNASASAELAQKWATQTTAEVVSGQGYGAKYYADQAADSAASIVQDAEAAAASATAAAGSASAAAQSAQEAASSASLADIQNKITNCLTKIPQDINLELSADGKLVLKNGSKIYKANGSFITASQDVSLSYGNKEDGLFIVINESNNLWGIAARNVTSGTVEPAVTGERKIWLDTTNNIVKMYAPNSYSYEEVSLPFAKASASGVDDKFSSIDQVFNGFGYIGKTIFVLPGVEGLIPNGRKADGSLNNIKFSVNRLLTRTNTSWNTVYIDNNGIYSSNSRKYNEEQNYNYELTGNSISKQTSIGRAFSSNDRITSFNPKFVFHAMEYRESIPFNYLGSITVCEGDSAIAGDYTLPQIAQSGADRLCLFCVHLDTTKDGGSSMALSSGVVTTPCEIAFANNRHSDVAAFFFPVDKTGKITVSFPGTGGGIGNLTSLKLIGYI